MRSWRRRSPRCWETRHQLPNNLVWLFSPQTELPLVNLELLIKAGALTDPPGKAGLANLTASLLRSGTKSRFVAKIASELDFMGAAPFRRRRW